MCSAPLLFARGTTVGGRAYARLVVQHWSPMSQLQRDVEPGSWIMFDKSTRVAIIRATEIQVGTTKRRLLRAVTWDADPERRVLLGYFPLNELDLAAAVVWAEWVKHNPPTSNRR